MPGHNPSPCAQAPSNRSPEDRRAFQRYAADLEVSCRPLGALRADSWPARLKDISAGGIGLVVERRFEPGTMLAVDLVSTGSGSPRTLLSRVRHVTAQPEGEWLLGVALLREMSEEELKNWGAEPARPKGPDSRAWVRFPCDIPGLCRDAGAASVAPWQATVVNISAGGCGLVTARPVKEGTHLHVDLPDADGQPGQRLLVRVVQLREQADGSWFLGCELTDGLSATDTAELQSPAPTAGKKGPSPPEPATDPDLARLCAAWAGLPEHVRASIRTLVASAP
jgi:c-di-GMP-binding flagellar brake protein YcgR